MISFIIPAHNEEHELPATLAAIRAAASGLQQVWEIIVVNDASTDSTPQIAEEAGARLVSINRRQIAAARNAGARVAQGEYLFFVDADTRINRAHVIDAIASITCARLIRVSASTKNRYSPCATRAPAFRAAAIWRRLIETSRAPASSAICGVLSVDASFTTIISHTCWRPEAAARIAASVAGSSCSSLCAGIMNEIITYFPSNLIPTFCTS